MRKTLISVVTALALTVTPLPAINAQEVDELSASTSVGNGLSSEEDSSSEGSSASKGNSSSEMGLSSDGSSSSSANGNSPSTSSNSSTSSTDGSSDLSDGAIAAIIITGILAIGGIIAAGGYWAIQQRIIPNPLPGIIPGPPELAPAPGPWQEPAPAPAPWQEPAPAPAPWQEPAPAPAPAPARPYYNNCAAVWNAIGRPIRSNEPGFQPKLDRDGNGVGCEKDPR